MKCLSSRTHVAKKDYEDSAGVWIRNQLDSLRIDVKMTFSEWRAISKLKENGWKIKKGQKYDYYAMVDGGYFYVFKCLPDIHKICVKYELYDTD